MRCLGNASEKIKRVKRINKKFPPSACPPTQADVKEHVRIPG